MIGDVDQNLTFFLGKSWCWSHLPTERHMWDLLRKGLGKFFEGDPYVTYRVPKCVSDD